MTPVLINLWKLTCPQKRDDFKRKCHLPTGIFFRGHVSFWGSKSLIWKDNLHPLQLAIHPSRRLCSFWGKVLVGRNQTLSYLGEFQDDWANKGLSPNCFFCYMGFPSYFRVSRLVNINIWGIWYLQIEIIWIFNLLFYKSWGHSGRIPRNPHEIHH